MRQLAVVAAAALVLAVIAPAFAQPFADVPTNHWAYDAIAELAAKGLIEGYPDGTFKGDRAMTRYEMAMVVARLLARIESIQIPAPAGPQVTKADLATIQRLVNEFRAELAALGVRVTALEEELNAIKARLDNVRITGATRLRYNDLKNATGPPLGGNGNPNTHSIDASNSPSLPIVIEQARLSFDGSVAPNIHFILSVLSNGSGKTSQAVFNSSAFGTGSQFTLASIDNAFLDWRNAWGTPLEIWVGRFGGGGSPASLGVTYPVKFGPFGLLLYTQSDLWRDSTLNSNFNVVDGLRVAGHFDQLYGLQFQGFIARVVGNTGGTTYFSGEDAYGGEVSFQVYPGVRLGGGYVSNQFTSPGNIPVAAGAPSALFHVYGPAGALSPATPLCPAVAKGITCAAQGNGYVGYVEANIIKGVHLDGEYATWNDTVNNVNDSGYKANFHVDLGSITGIGHAFFLDAGYLYLGQNFYPPYGDANADVAPVQMIGHLFPGNTEGEFAKLSYGLTRNWTLYAEAFSGHHISNGQYVLEWEGGGVYRFAPGASIVLKAREMRINEVEQFLLYRAQVDYSF